MIMLAAFPSGRERGDMFLSPSICLLNYGSKCVLTDRMREVLWETSDGPVPDRETALYELKRETAEFIICDRCDGWVMQACKEGDATYFCELLIPEKDKVYATPKPLTWEELVELFDRYAAGDDFSYVQTQWTAEKDPTPRYLKPVIGTIVVTVVILVILRECGVFG